MEKLVRGFKSVVLASDAPDATAAFYRDLFDLPLAEERHRGTQRHHACQLGDMHFAIHERASFWLPAETVVSFTVDRLEPLRERLAARGVEPAAETRIGPMAFLALRDPDGRYLCAGTPWPVR